MTPKHYFVRVGGRPTLYLIAKDSETVQGLKCRVLAKLMKTTCLPTLDQPRVILASKHYHTQATAIPLHEAVQVKNYHLEHETMIQMIVRAV